MLAWDEFSKVNTRIWGIWNVSIKKFLQEHVKESGRFGINPMSLESKSLSDREEHRDSGNYLGILIINQRV